MRVDLGDRIPPPPAQAVGAPILAMAEIAVFDREKGERKGLGGCFAGMALLDGIVEEWT